MSMGRVILPRGTAPLPPFFSAHRIASSESLAATNLGDWKQLDWRNGVATAVYKLIASHSPLFILFLEMLNAPHYLKFKIMILNCIASEKAAKRFQFCW